MVVQLARRERSQREPLCRRDPFFSCERCDRNYVHLYVIKFPRLYGQVTNFEQPLYISESFQQVPFICGPHIRLSLFQLVLCLTSIFTLLDKVLERLKHTISAHHRHDFLCFFATITEVIWPFSNTPYVPYVRNVM